MVNAMMFSNTAMMDDSAAKLMNTKNSVHHNWPSGIWLKTPGSVMNTKLGPLPGSTPNAKHAGEDDKAGNERNRRVQRTDAQRLARQAAAFVDVAAEDHHRANAQGQREERLAHGRVRRFRERRQLSPQSCAREHLPEIGNQVERKARFGARQA